MSGSTYRRRFVFYTELLAKAIAAHGGKTIAVTLPVPDVAYIVSVSNLCGRTPTDWIFQAILERAERDGVEIERACQSRCATERRGNVHPDPEPVTSPTINAIDRMVQHCVAAAYAAGDVREVDRLGMRHVALKRQIANLAPIEREIVADQALRELQAEIVP